MGARLIDARSKFDLPPVPPAARDEPSRLPGMIRTCIIHVADSFPWLNRIFPGLFLRFVKNAAREAAVFLRSARPADDRCRLLLPRVSIIVSVRAQDTACGISTVFPSTRHRESFTSRRARQPSGFLSLTRVPPETAPKHLRPR